MVLFKRKSHHDGNSVSSLKEKKTLEDSSQDLFVEKEISNDLMESLENNDQSNESGTINNNEKRNTASIDMENIADDNTDEVLEPDIAELPVEVREIVSMEDDPTIQVFTFRYVVLSIILVCPGAFIDTLNFFRINSIDYSLLFVQICSHWMGKFLAKFLPNKRISLFGIRLLSFNLNPCPWSMKETVLITITVGAGSTASPAILSFVLGDAVYHQPIKAIYGMLFMWSTIYIGYSYAALARNFLVYDPVFIWPQALMQTSLCQSMIRYDNDSKKGRKQMRIFLYAFIFITLWQFLPQYAFPMTTSLAFLCWVAPHNETANFIGSGFGGMGFLNFTLDWYNISSSIMITPYWVQAIEFCAFVFGAWILIPIARYRYSVPPEELMSNKVFTANGTQYPVQLLLERNNQTLNETTFHTYGALYISPQRAWNTFFDYASFTSGFVWAFVFGFEGMKATLVKLVRHHKEKKKQKKLNIKVSNIHDQYTDRLNKLQSKYDDVPDWWYGALCLASIAVLLGLTASESIPLAWWSVLIALIIGVFLVVPLAWLYAFSNFQLDVGNVNELINGSIITLLNYPRNLLSSSLYGCVAGETWYHCQRFLVDQKFGFYNGISPKLIFMSQLFGTLISVPINYACMVIIETYKLPDWLASGYTDTENQWNFQILKNLHTDAIQYLVIGPRRLFELYPQLPYGFLLGALSPFVFWFLEWFFPKSKLKFHLWNTTVFYSKMGTFYGNISTGYLSQFIGGTITMFWIFRYRHSLWKDYNYIVAAALDIGSNLTVLLILLFFGFKFKQMPYWFGNNDQNIERCFAMRVDVNASDKDYAYYFDTSLNAE